MNSINWSRLQRTPRLRIGWKMCTTRITHNTMPLMVSQVRRRSTHVSCTNLELVLISQLGFNRYWLDAVCPYTRQTKKKSNGSNRMSHCIVVIRVQIKVRYSSIRFVDCRCKVNRAKLSRKRAISIESNVEQAHDAGQEQRLFVRLDRGSSIRNLIFVQIKRWMKIKWTKIRSAASFGAMDRTRVQVHRLVERFTDDRGDDRCF